MGAVVINAAREAVRACYFTGGTWAPEDTTLHLQTVPALGSPEHADWPHTWDQFITRNL